MDKRLIIDTDTAGDDVVSLLLALRTPGVKLEAITTVAGNVPLPLCTRNALITVETAGRPDVRVYQGADRPFLRELVTCEYVHGNDGMGDSGIPESSLKPQAEHAVNAIVRLVNQYPGEIEIVAQAPLTNIALAYMMDPTIAQKVKRLWVMGGSNNFIGNVTPAAEFNFYVDPHAAKIVFGAGFNLTMIGWEICLRHAVLDMDDLKKVEALGTKLSRFFLDVNAAALRWNTSVGTPGTTHPDAIMCAMAIDERVLSKSDRYFVDVEVASELTMGYSFVDALKHMNKEPNAEVCLEADFERFRSMLMDVLRQKD